MSVYNNEEVSNLEENKHSPSFFLFLFYTLPYGKRVSKCLNLDSNQFNVSQLSSVNGVIEDSKVNKLLCKLDLSKSCMWT